MTAPTADAPDHDAFFDELYEATTEPFLTPAMTDAEVRCFVALVPRAEGARVLDLGCGWGRHLQPLRSAGFRPFGVERSRRYARRANTGGPVPVADVRDLPFASGTFDAAACFYSSLFFFDDAGNRQAFAEAARVLKPGGRFVFQSANPVHLRRLGEQATTHVLPDGTRIFESSEFDLETRCERGFRRMTKPDGTTREGRYAIRHHAPGELEVLGHRHGLRVDKLAGSLDLAPFTRQSRELVMSFRKT